MISVVTENPESKTAISASALLDMSEDTSGAKASALTVPQSQGVGEQAPQEWTLADDPDTEISIIGIPLVLGSVFVHVPSNWLRLAEALFKLKKIKHIARHSIVFLIYPTSKMTFP